MPWKHVSTVLGKEYDGPTISQIGNYLGKLKEVKIADVSIQTKNAKIALDTSGWRWWYRSLEAIMTTRLEGENIERFYQEVPNFLRRTKESDLDFSVSRALGAKGEEQFLFDVGIMAGYASNKQAIRNQSDNKFVAQASYPEGYSGKELDGYYVGRLKEDVFAKYLRLAVETEKLGFIKSVMRPEEGKCMSMVCIHPWEMVEKEFVDFAKSMMQRKETKKLTLSSSSFQEEKHRKVREYSFRATVFPKSHNVEVAVVGWGYPGSITDMFGESLNLFDVELSKDDKVSYERFYEGERRTRGSLKNVGAKIGRAIKTPFALAGGGILSVRDAARGKWDNYQTKKQRKIDELKREIRNYGIEPNKERVGSCYVALDKACIIRSIEKKKAEKIQQTD